MAQEVSGDAAAPPWFYIRTLGRYVSSDRSRQFDGPVGGMGWGEWVGGRVDAGGRGGTTLINFRPGASTVFTAP